jgi:hypothetical protein
MAFLSAALDKNDMTSTHATITKDWVVKSNRDLLLTFLEREVQNQAQVITWALLPTWQLAATSSSGDELCVLTW